MRTINKNVFGIGLGMILMTSACKKSDTGPANSWTVGANTFTSGTVIGSLFGGTFTLEAYSKRDTTVKNSIQFEFMGSTPTAGNYKVASGNYITANTVFVVTTNTVAGFPGKDYICNRNDNTYITVTVSEKKVSITLPETYAKSYDGDSLKVSANSLTQQ